MEISRPAIKETSGQRYLPVALRGAALLHEPPLPVPPISHPKAPTRVGGTRPPLVVGAGTRGGSRLGGHPQLRMRAR